MLTREKSISHRVVELCGAEMSAEVSDERINPDALDRLGVAMLPRTETNSYASTSSTAAPRCRNSIGICWDEGGRIPCNGSIDNGEYGAIEGNSGGHHLVQVLFELSRRNRDVAKNPVQIAEMFKQLARLSAGTRSLWGTCRAQAGCAADAPSGFAGRAEAAFDSPRWTVSSYHLRMLEIEVYPFREVGQRRRR
jgi:hypothetical protein